VPIGLTFDEELMKTIAFFLSLLALSCCSRDAVSPGAHVSQLVPGKAPPAADSASRVRDASAAVDVHAAGVEARAATMSRETRSLREALNATTAEADRMRKLASTTKEEMSALWAQLTDLSRRSLLLEDEAAAAVKALDEQRELRRLATVQITEMEIAARNKDHEANALRMQFEDERGRSLALHKLAEDNAAAAMTAKASADKLKGARNLAIGFGVVVAGVSGLLFWLNSVNPLRFLRA
jgi:hypothetical protein